MNQTIAPLFDCDFLLNTMPREKKNEKASTERTRQAAAGLRPAAPGQRLASLGLSEGRLARAAEESANASRSPALAPAGRGDLIRTARGGRTITPAPNSVYGPGRLREQNVAAPVPDGEIDSACELSSRTRSRTIVECPPCLSLPPACDFASGTHPPAQCRLWSFE